MTDGDGLAIDDARSRDLWDVGLPDYQAVTSIDSRGTRHYVLACVSGIGDEDARFDANCVGVLHEQVGELPPEYLQRIQRSEEQT